MLEGKAQEPACMAVMQAFNAPYSARMLANENADIFDTDVGSQGKIFVTTELGRAGTSCARSVAIASKRIRNFLIHAGEIDILPSV